MSHQILILENDPSLTSNLSQVFVPYFWHVTVAVTLKNAYQVVTTQDFEAAIVDRVLSDGDGLEFIAYLRDWYPGIKILCLSSRGEVTERIKGFTQGADDYLPKPFATQELIWRIKSLLNKQKISDAPCLEHQTFKFYPENGTFLGQKRKVILRRRENQLLLFLLRHKGQVVTRRMLMDALWPGDQELPMQTTLDVYIRRLRQRLPEYPSLIKTVRGYGYSISA